MCCESCDVLFSADCILNTGSCKTAGDNRGIMIYFNSRSWSYGSFWITVLELDILSGPKI